AGGTIYGDAYSMSGGQAGNDRISVVNMSGGVIYGDAAVGSAYTPGENEIFVTNTMSGGTINAGNGYDSVDVGTLSGSGIINSGAGDDSIKVGTMSGGVINASGASGMGCVDVTTMNGGTINTSGGSDKVQIATANGGTLVLGASAATIATLEGAVTAGNGTVAQNVEVTNLNNGGTLTTGSGADVITVTALNSGGTINTGDGADVVNITTANGGTLVLGAASTATIVNLAGAVTAGNGTVAQNINVTNFNSTGTLTTGSGNDSVDITTYSGGKIKLGNGQNNLSITTQNADLDIADILSSQGLTIHAGSGGSSDTISIGTLYASGLFNAHLTLDSSTSGKTLIIDTLNGGTTSGSPGLVYLGGDNVVEINAMSDSVHICGDSDEMIGASGGDSSITLKNTLSAGAALFGDATTMTDNSIGGDDSIEITGDMNGSGIFGDCNFMTDSEGGNDSIRIHGTMTGGSIYGDGGFSMTNSIGGNDSIHIGTMDTGSVYGDGYYMTDSKSGADSIRVDTMNGGTIVGDGQAMLNCEGGNDIIQIGTMYQGTIYGETGSTPVNYTAGNNKIIIGTLAGAGTKTIRSGAGEDTVAILGAEAGAWNSNVSLGQELVRDGKQDYLDLSAMTTLGSNTTITVNGFDINNNGVYDKIIYGSGIWTTPADTDLGNGDKYTLTHIASGYTLTLNISGVSATQWQYVSADSIP
ncbi:autotransporter adhesin family protein, partial [Desulfovibrio sp. OttesenSCG-928-G11]|nr:autotransporter adhesin family protein [Desulfovibrio sp. OttesenSCG-928-G11]